jgi:hypothetical protein
VSAAENRVSPVRHQLIVTTSRYESTELCEERVSAGWSFSPDRRRCTQTGRKRQEWHELSRACRLGEASTARDCIGQT